MNRIKKANILLVEDEKTTAVYYAALIRSQGYQVTICHEGEQALRLLQEGNDFDLMLLDLGLPDISGWDILNFMKQSKKLRYIPILVVTSTDDKVSFLKALQQGAEDFLIKPVDVDTMLNRMAVMLRIRNLYKDLQQEHFSQPVNQRLRNYLARHMGPSLVVKHLAQQAELLLDHETTILLEGEPGTGKRLLAETIHRFSARSKGPLVRVRCGQGAETKFLARLLGLENQSKMGALEKASGGTLFLQDIHALSPLSQLTVLQIIQDQQFKRLGGSTAIDANMHIMLSTSKDLKAMVDCNQFREDLYYRLNVVSFKLPSLNSRLEDIPFLAQEFLNRKYARKEKDPPVLSKAAIQALQGYPWRENVRELFEVLEYAALMHNGPTLDVEHLPLKDRTAIKSTVSHPPHTLAEQERRLITETLQRTGGNKSKTATALGISRSTLYNKMAAWGIKG